LKFSKDIASGMSMVHALGIAHRDLKSFFFFSSVVVLNSDYCPQNENKK